MNTDFSPILYSIQELEEKAKQKTFVDYNSVPGVINFDLLKKALLKYRPEGKVSELIAEKERFEDCNNIAIEYFDVLRIDFLWVMPNLTRLSLANNLIEKIERLDSLVHLVELNLSYNKIGKIENLKHLVNLKILNLFGNLISKIENLEELTKLRLLSLGDNAISSLENIAYLRPFQDLKSLCLSGNPLETCKNNCKAVVSALLPQLVYFNYSLIQDDDRELGRSLNLEMIEEIEENERKEEETRAIELEKENRKEYLQRAMIEGFDNNEFFEFLMKDDANYNLIRGIGEDSVDIFNDYQEKLMEYSARIRVIGETYLVKREAEVKKYEEAVENNEKLCGEIIDKILSDLRRYRREWKVELLDLLLKCREQTEMYLQKSLQRSQEIKVLFGDIVKQAWYKLMDLEMKRYDFAKERNGKYELALKDIVSKQIESFQAVFADVRETEKEIKEALYDVISRIVTEFRAHRENMRSLPPQLKMMFSEPESLQSFVKTSYEQHLFLIDTMEDEIITKLSEWLDVQIGHLSKKEYDRNRVAVYELNCYLDNQINYFDKMSKPLLTKCQHLLNEQYAEKIKNNIYDKYEGK